MSSVKDQWLPDLFSEPVVPIIQSSYSFDLIAQHQSLNFSYCHTYKPTNEKKKRERERERAGADGGFVIEGAKRYSIQ